MASIVVVSIVYRHHLTRSCILLYQMTHGQKPVIIHLEFELPIALSAVLYTKNYLVLFSKKRICRCRCRSHVEIAGTPHQQRRGIDL
jgi:hypothetical protein